MRTGHSSNMPYTPRNTTMIVTMMMACMVNQTLTTTGILEMPHSITQSSQNALGLYWMKIHYLNVAFEEESVTQRWVGDRDICTFFPFCNFGWWNLSTRFQNRLPCIRISLTWNWKANPDFTENWLCKNKIWCATNNYNDTCQCHPYEKKIDSNFNSAVAQINLYIHKNAMF